MLPCCKCMLHCVNGWDEMMSGVSTSCNKVVMFLITDRDEWLSHWLSSFILRYIQSTCATSGEGLYEGLDWLSSNIATKVFSLLFNNITLSSLVYELTLLLVFCPVLKNKLDFDCHCQVEILLGRKNLIWNIF
jgi:hypothetical protein